MTVQNDCSQLTKLHEQRQSKEQNNNCKYVACLLLCYADGQGLGRADVAWVIDFIRNPWSRSLPLVAHEISALFIGRVVAVSYTHLTLPTMAVV